MSSVASDVILANGSSMVSLPYMHWPADWLSSQRHKVLFIATFLLANDDLTLPPDALSIVSRPAIGIS